jgi:predicted transcriptional regulator of viral defense system
VCVLNGRNTNKLGVIARGPISFTDLERTLIDIAVRPIYAGGVHEIARVYSEAQGTLSVNKLVAYLRKLNYTYPYHQAIGYYLDRAGVYSETQLALLRQFEFEFDFYLAHQMKETDYVEKWRLFVPKGF